MDAELQRKARAMNTAITKQYRNDKYVSYFRVSTRQQGINGLGIEAQRAAAKQFLQGAKAKHEFVEVESGKRNQRPELDRAIACCRTTKSKLIIAKLDRLSRNASFLMNLMESNVDFVCCDMPNADKFTIRILACVAQEEAERISQRTRDALQAAKRRGVKLGNPKIAKIQPKAVAAKKQQAIAFAAKLAPVIALAGHASMIFAHRASDLAPAVFIC